jgi:hypothetical protein
MSFNIPVVTLVDVPGFLPGVEQERSGIIRHGAKLLYRVCLMHHAQADRSSCARPMAARIWRCAAQEMGADFVYAWPTAEIAVMGAEGAVNLLYRKELDEAKDRRAKSAELVGRLPCRVRLALSVGGPRLHHRRHRSRGNPADARPRPAQAAQQARTATGQETREHPAVRFLVRIPAQRRR